jgi:hypothetical protein
MMRLNALYFIGALTIWAMPASAGAAEASPTAAVPARTDRQAAVDARQGMSAAQVCPPGYYWEPSSYAKHGKFRPAHCARRW